MIKVQEIVFGVNLYSIIPIEIFDEWPARLWECTEYFE